MDNKVADEEALLNNAHETKSIDNAIRLGFVRKVYGILSAQLLLTTFMAALTFSQPVKEFYLTHPLILILMFVLAIGILIPLICCQNVARKTPTNYILLFIWTFCEGYLVATCCAMYNPQIVISAAALTCAIVIALTLYACTTKTDFTFAGGLLFVSCTLLLFLGILSIFLPFLHVIYCILGVFLFSIYLIFDTQLIMGQYGNKYDTEDYIIAAINIYLDIVQIFLYILELLGNRN